MKRFQLPLYIVLAIGLNPWFLSGQTLSERIKATLNKGYNAKVHYSIFFYDIENRHCVFEYNADRPQKPASNMKLITTATALDVLGPDYHFETIYGLFDGDLCIIAGGDPLLGDPVVAQRKGVNIFDGYRQVCEALRKNNIEKISGNLLIDDFVFDNERFHPSWPVEQENNWYTAQISGLCFNDNCIDISFKPGAAPGDMAQFTCLPDTKFITVNNKCKTVASNRKTAVGVLRSHNTNEMTLIGTCGVELEKPVSATIDNPSAFHGYTLAEYLHQQGITIEGVLVIKRILEDQNQLPAGFNTILNIRTPIQDVLRESNQRSLNLVAECLMKTIGAHTNKTHRDGSWESGRKAVIAFLKRIHLNTDNLVVDDGSGLSHENRISARAMAMLLHYMDKSAYAAVFRESLATAENGTLSKKDRFSEDRYADRVFAKTGYINGTNALSGYCLSQTGKKLAFSILTQDPPGSNRDIDNIVKLVIDYY